VQAYRKTSTRDPYCVYLTKEDAMDIMAEVSEAQTEPFKLTAYPTLAKLAAKLDKVYGSKEAKRA
jgi:hypothetical protein